MNAAPEPHESALGTSDIKDPATDLTASYALEPSYVRPLLARVLASSGETVPTYCPFNGQPLAMIPQSTPQDVDEAFRRARRAQEQWARTSFAERAEKLLALHDLILDRQKEFFENGHTAFENGRKSKAADEARAAQIERLEAKLQRKNEVLAELMEEHTQLKKELGEL